MVDFGGFRDGAAEVSIFVNEGWFLRVKFVFEDEFDGLDREGRIDDV